MSRILTIAVIGAFIISCSQGKNNKKGSIDRSTTEIQKTESFDWLLGKWKRLNEDEGKETFENWNKISKTEYSGIGFTMHNGDTIKQEKIRLFRSNAKWYLTVKVPEEAESVTFNVTEHNAGEFTSENSEIDFPNKIRYWKKGGKLYASVSNPEMEISFEFEKLEQ